jgi:hypothetical protein
LTLPALHRFPLALGKSAQIREIPCLHAQSAEADPILAGFLFLLRSGRPLYSCCGAWHPKRRALRRTRKWPPDRSPRPKSCTRHTKPAARAGLRLSGRTITSYGALERRVQRRPEQLESNRAGLAAQAGRPLLRALHTLVQIKAASLSRHALLSDTTYMAENHVAPQLLEQFPMRPTHSRSLRPCAHREKIALDHRVRAAFSGPRSSRGDRV